MKRWSYATAIMLSLAGGTIMTGCIDNDEPYGIEQIRLATADFLKSKKAAVEAEAAAANAQVEIEKIKAETEKLRIEAEAAIKAAQAKILEAQANKEQAEADKIKAETDAYIAAQKAKLDEFIAQAEIRVKQSELDYQTALYWFEQTKITNAEAATSKLYQAWALAFQSYLDQLSIVNGLNQKYLLVQKDYALAEIDLKYNKVSGEWESNKYDAIVKLGNTVTWLEKEIKKQNDEIAFQQSVIADFENVKTSDLYQLFEKYNAANTANTEALAKAKVELETLAVENKALYDKRADLQNQVNKYNSNEIAIPAYTWTPDAKLSAIGLTEPVEIVPERVTYSLDAQVNYITYTRMYEGYIDQLNSYILDENDKAWTAARINEMKRQVAETNTELTAAQKEWEMAKTVYNDGKDVVAASLPEQAGVKAAVDAYNAVGAASTALQNAIVTAKEAEITAHEAYLKAYYNYWGNEEVEGTGADAVYAKALKAYENADTDAKEAQNASITAAERTKASEIETAKNSIINAKEELALAKATVAKLEDAVLNNPYPTLSDELDDAREKVTEKEDDLEEAETAAGEAITSAEEKCNKAIVAANVKYEEAISAAKKELDKAENAYKAAGYGDAGKDPMYDAVKAALDTYDAAKTASTKAFSDFVASKNKIWDAYADVKEAIQKQLQALNISYWPISWQSYANVYYYVEGDSDEFPEAVTPIECKNADAVYENALYLLIRKSNIAYGILATVEGNGVLPWENGYVKDAAFLLPKDKITVATLNEYIKKDDPDMDQFNYYTVYDRFGLFGTSCQLENRIKVAQAYIDNANLLTEATATLQKNLDALEKSNADAIEAGVELSNQLADVDKEITALEQGVKDKIADLDHWSVQYGNILSTITSAIETVENITPIKGDQYVQGNIDAVIKALVEGANDEIAKANNQIEYLNKQLDKAKYQLGLYEENKDTVLPNPYTIALEVAEANLAAAQEKLAFLKAHADELQAKYEAASKQ